MPDRLGLATAAAAAWGLPAPVLVRTGMNSVYAAGDEVMIRVGPPVHPVEDELAWFALLGRIGVRAPEVLHDPVRAVDGTDVAVAIRRIVPEGTVDWREVGAMVRRVHGIDPADVPGLPFCGHFAHWQIGALLEETLDRIDPPALAGLLQALARWEGWDERLGDHPVVCHGDVHPGNVMPTAAGPVLLDWDLRSLAPIAWDHGPLMTWEHRWDGEPGTYAAFAEGYGLDLRGDWMGECMAELRNVVATLLRVRAGITDPSAKAEADRRLRYWRHDPDAPRWHPM